MPVATRDTKWTPTLFRSLRRNVQRPSTAESTEQPLRTSWRSWRQRRHEQSAPPRSRRADPSVQELARKSPELCRPVSPRRQARPFRGALGPDRRDLLRRSSRDRRALLRRAPRPPPCPTAAPTAAPIPVYHYSVVSFRTQSRFTSTCKASVKARKLPSKLFNF